MNPIEMTTENSPTPAHVYRGVCEDLNLSVLNSIFFRDREMAVFRWQFSEMNDGRKTYFEPESLTPALDAMADSLASQAVDIPVTEAAPEEPFVPASPCASWVDDLAETRARANTKGLQNGLLLFAGVATLVISVFVAGIMLGVRVGGLMH